MRQAFPITAFLEGMNTGEYDLEKSKLTDCPYWHETMAAKQWWEGYHRAQTEILTVGLGRDARSAEGTLRTPK